MSWLRSREYNDYFDYLDRAGGVSIIGKLTNTKFFYHRWGDAPIHSLAVGLYLKPEQIHYFGDIAYRHDDRITCPIKGSMGNLNTRITCSCDLDEDEYRNKWMYRNWADSSALHYFWRMNKIRGF